MNEDSAAMSAFLQVVESNHFLTKNLLSAGEGSLADHLDSLVAADPPRFRSAQMVDSLVAELAAIEQPKQAARVLRSFYAGQLIRIAHGEFVRDWPPDRVGRQISAVADAVIDAALRFVIGRLSERRGMPERPDGSTPQVTVIGLGNLGGQEIGYTAPLKLLFLYDAIDEKNVWHRDFYQTVVADVVELLRGPESRTDGIDIDLREGPRYEVGVSICSFREALRIYETSGRIWQRLNFVKARVVAGSSKVGNDFLNRLQPWIYRQFISRVDLAELRTLRAKIEKRGAELSMRQGEPNTSLLADRSQQDIARAPGGRDDVELTIQFLQLLHGSSLPSVRSGNTYEAIAALEQAGCLTNQEATLLLANYARLCRLQHQLSMMFDRTGRQLPEDPDAKCRLAWQLGIRTQDGSEGDLDRFQGLLADTFNKNRKVIDHLMLDAPSGEAEVAIETELLLDPDPDPREVETALLKHGLAEPSRAMDNLRALATETVPFLSHHRCRHFLSSIAPALLQEISRTPNPDQALSSLETVTDSLGAKATLWELLAGSRPTMKLMVRLCATAPYLTEILTNNPGMIDELIDSLLMNRLPSAQRLDAHSIELCRGATDIDRILHSFKNSSHLTIGVRDILNKESLEATHQAIGDTAEACLRRVIEYEQEQLADQFGDPVDSDGDPAELVMLALGKLGGREPNYHSDIDAVFLYSADGQTQRRVGGHRATLTNQLFFNQLAQRVITRVNDSRKMRRLYELDSRMRPSDEEGGWALSTDAFFQFINGPSVPLWQRLDLCRARPISGSRLLRQRIEGLIEETIFSSDWQPEMGREVRTIRHRMEQTAHEDNLKRGVGGTVDVELVAQSLTLQYAKDFPQIIQHGTTATLAALAETGCLDEKKSLELINGYRTLRRIEANLRLMNTPARHELPTSDAGEMKNLAYLMNESDPAMLVAQCRQARQNNRAIFDQVFGMD